VRTVDHRAKLMALAPLTPYGAISCNRFAPLQSVGAQTIAAGSAAGVCLARKRLGAPRRRQLEPRAYEVRISRADLREGEMIQRT